MSKIVLGLMGLTLFFISLPLINSLNITEEEKVCQEIFISSSEKQGNFKEGDLLVIKEKLSWDISFESLLNYFNNYNSLCLDNNFSGELPIKPSPSVDLFKKTSFNECSTKTGVDFFDGYFPLPSFRVNSNISCGSIDFFRIFINFDKDDMGNISVDGVKLWFLLIAPILLFIFLTFRLDKDFKRLSKSLKSNITKI